MVFLRFSKFVRSQREPLGFRPPQSILALKRVIEYYSPSKISYCPTFARQAASITPMILPVAGANAVVQVFQRLESCARRSHRRHIDVTSTDAFSCVLEVTVCRELPTRSQPGSERAGCIANVSTKHGSFACESN